MKMTRREFIMRVAQTGGSAYAAMVGLNLLPMPKAKAFSLTGQVAGKRVIILGAGLAGMTEVSGVVHRLQERISTSYGFSGVIVAWLAKLHPFAVIVVSILFGALLVASREIQPSGISFLIQGITLFLVISSDVLLKYEIKWVRPAQETAQ